MRVVEYEDLRVPKRLRSSLDRVKAQLEREDFRSADVKKLRGHAYYRARLDYDSRLVLDFVRVGDERACLALEIVESHAYDRSRFLRGAKVDEEKVLEEIPAEEALGSARAVRYLHPTSTSFELLDKPISFDDAQRSILRARLPLLLVGGAGSGKTALTLSKLRALAGDVLYVTQSRFLAENAASLYYAHGYSNDAQQVEFFSYAKLLESIAVPEGRPVGLADFARFFDRHRQTYKLTSAHALFEELRGVLTADARGPLTEDEYMGLGVRQSIYAVGDRNLIHGALAKYTAWLSEAKLYDTNLLAHAYRAHALPRYDAVVVDEIQDLTNAELALILALLKDPKAFMLCGDANQIVHPNFFSWAKVKSLFYRQEEEALTAKVHVLAANYRSSRTVCQLANGVLKIKNARFGSIDRESTVLARPVGDLEGRVAGLPKKDAVLRELDKRMRGSAKVAVIVLRDEHKAEAKKRFSTPLVFSIHEAKGLEYETVILYDLVSSERGAYRDVTEGIVQGDLEVDDLTYARAKDKGDKSIEVYKFFVNALYVSLTRAIETIYVVESDTTHPLLGLLRLTFSEDVSSFVAKASTLEEWQKEARRLELQGKQEQAEAIRKTILKTEKVPWPVLHGEGFRDVFEKAFAPRSVFSKAKQQVFELGAFHAVSPLSVATESRAGYAAQRRPSELAPTLHDRALAPYRETDGWRVIADVDKYGVDHRTMFSLTPLMLAAWAGNSALVETLLDRGANKTEVDVFGRTALHHALRVAGRDPAYAADKLGALYELLCPTVVELEVDGRLVGLSRAQGEFFVLARMQAEVHGLWDRFALRRSGFTSALLDENALSAFPRSVVPEVRRKRSYWNSVLARAEVDASYVPARKLWVRERQGHYMPSPKLRVRVRDGEAGTERFVALVELLRLPLVSELSSVQARGRWS
jgi:hypothetical protein